MSVEKNTRYDSEVVDPKLKLSSGYTLFDLECRFTLQNRKYTYFRRAYTFLDLLGDFGGLNDAIVMIVSFFMKYYSETRFKATISQEYNAGADPTPANLARLNDMHSKLKND